MISSFRKSFIGHFFINDQTNMNDKYLQNNWSGKEMSDKSSEVYIKECINNEFSMCFS